METALIKRLNERQYVNINGVLSQIISFKKTEKSPREFWDHHNLNNELEGARWCIYVLRREGRQETGEDTETENHIWQIRRKDKWKVNKSEVVLTMSQAQCKFKSHILSFPPICSFTVPGTILGVGVTDTNKSEVKTDGQDFQKSSLKRHLRPHFCIPSNSSPPAGMQIWSLGGHPAPWRDFGEGKYRLGEKSRERVLNSLLWISSTWQRTYVL